MRSLRASKFAAATLPATRKTTRKTVRHPALISAELLESRKLFTAGPTITLTASIPTASGITGANGQLLFTRDGSTASPIKVYYHASGTLDSHDYTKLSGVVTIHGGYSTGIVDLKPKVGVVLATDPVLNVVLTQYKTYRRGSPHVATITVTEAHTSGGGTVTPPVTSGEQYSIPIDISSGSYARTNEPIDNSVNFTSAISAAGGTSAALNTDSIRVVEVDGSGNVLDSNVPFQFDQASGYDATTNASGDLIVQLSGATAANVTRHYEVQFATSGTFTAPTFTNQVSTVTGTDNVGLAAYKVTNATATYVIQQSTGGISSIIDTDGNDWVGFNSAGGSAGQYRGVPNLGTNSGLHPYDPSTNFPTSGAQNSATVSIINSGPLKTTLSVVSTDGLVNVTYEFYNNFVRATVNQDSEAAHYWFLYEGTPGGGFSTGDKLVTSDGANQTLDQVYDANSGIGSGNASTGQWASFQSQNENRFIYFAQNTQDTNEDSYFDLNNQMTVFGFGRTYNTQTGGTQVESGSNTYTFGIANGNTTAATTINGQYRAATNTVGTGTLI